MILSNDMVKSESLVMCLTRAYQRRWKSFDAVGLNVAFIGGGAFSFCKSLMTVKFEKTSKLSGINYDISPVSYYETGIELGTFYGCTALTSITLPSCFD